MEPSFFKFAAGTIKKMLVVDQTVHYRKPISAARECFSMVDEVKMSV